VYFRWHHQAQNELLEIATQFTLEISNDILSIKRISINNEISFYKKIKGYSIELEFECFRNTLALGVGSIAKNVDDGFFIRTKSLHGSPPE
jgi:hypothetical protein